MNLSTSDSLKLAAIVGVGVLAFIVARKALGLAEKGAELVGDGLQAINPTNPENIFAEAVNDLGGALADDPDWSLGVWLYELTHDDEMAEPDRTTSSGASTDYEADTAPYYAP